MPAKVDEAYRVWITARLGSGAPATGIVSGDFAIVVRNPGDTATMAAPTVTESGGGLYHFDILAAFSLAHGSGVYAVVIEIDSTTPLLRDTRGSSIEFFGSNIDDVPNLVWDELLTGLTHNIQNSAGKLLRNLAGQVIHTDTAQGPAANGNQIKLALAAPSFDGAFDPSHITITDGTGAGQTRNIFQYEGSTRIATVDRSWKVNPDATSEYVIFADAGREHVNEGLVQGGTSNTVTLNALASNIDNVYLFQTIFLRSGEGEDQIGIVIAYDGATKVATIDGAWSVIPDTTTAYAMLPMHTNPLVEQFTAYGNVVTIDMASGSAGQVWPVGTGETPANNIPDALAIGIRYGISRFRVVGMTTIGPADDISGLLFEGTDALVDTISLSSGCVTEGTSFRNTILTGVVAGGIFCDKVGLISISNLGSDVNPTLFNECVLVAGTIAFKAGLTTPQNVQFVRCIAGIGVVVVDFNSGNSNIAFRAFAGSATVRNHTVALSTIMDFVRGALVAEASCTAGTMVIGGNVSPIVDNAAGMALDTSSVIAKEATQVSIETTVLGAPAPTSSAFATGLTQADGFWTNVQIVVTNAATGVAVVRNVDNYVQTNGVVSVDALPFVPTAGDPVMILRRQGRAIDIIASNLPGL